MKFVIERASRYGEMPCSGCYKKSIPYKSVRLIRDDKIDEINKHLSEGKFLEKRKTNNTNSHYYVIEKYYDTWVIELDETKLFDLFKQQGNIVLLKIEDTCLDKEYENKIIIYDGYIE